MQHREVGVVETLSSLKGYRYLNTCLRPSTAVLPALAQLFRDEEKLRETPDVGILRHTLHLEHEDEGRCSHKYVPCIDRK